MKTTKQKGTPATSKKPRGVSSVRKQKALTLIRGWAAGHVQLNYIDSRSGLRHSGFIVDTSDDDLPSFEFSGHGGTSATILPLLWRKLDVQTVTAFESVHVGEGGGRSYGLTPAYVPKSRKTDLECAKAQLLLWRSRGVILHFLLNQESFNFSFGGSIAQLNSAGFSAEIQGTHSLLVMGFENLAYKVGRDGEGTKIEVVNRNTRTRLTISEIECEPEDLLSSTMVN